jgi:hypothetical protein
VNLARTSVRMWTAAVDFATTVRAELAEGVSTVKWKRRPRQCPPWCAKSHHCSAQHGYPSGQHRSEPAAWNLSYGRLVATRVASFDGRHQLELRAALNLPAGDDESAGYRAQELLTAVHIAFTALTTTTRPIAARVADRELTGGRR